MVLRFIHIVVSHKFILFVPEYLLFHYLNTTEFLHFYVDDHLGYFQILSVINQVLYIFLDKSFCGLIFAFLLGALSPRRAIA